MVSDDGKRNSTKKNVKTTSRGYCKLFFLAGIAYVLFINQRQQYTSQISQLLLTRAQQLESNKRDKATSLVVESSLLSSTSSYQREDKKNLSFNDDGLNRLETERENLGHRLAGLPPLRTLIDVERSVIISNVDFLLDFVIAGFAKTGTTTLSRNYFDKHPEIAIPRQEVHLLTQFHPPSELVEVLFNLSKTKTGNSRGDTGKVTRGSDIGRDDVKILRGYKAPRDIASFHVHDILDEYFPKAKLIVGLRHPIDWFHSFYNFKLRSKGKEMPPADLLIGGCLMEQGDAKQMALYRRTKLQNMDDRGVCADLTRYHVRLSWMGKTNLTDPDELALLQSAPDTDPVLPRLAKRAPIRNPIFLYEMTQLAADQDTSNRTRLTEFLHDLQKYLDLEKPFPLPKKPKAILNHDKHMFDICLPKYKPLRQVLLHNGKQAYLWITRYFLDHPDVHVSSRDYFEELLKTYQIDPCDSPAAVVSKDSGVDTSADD